MKYLRKANSVHLESLSNEYIDCKGRKYNSNFKKIQDYRRIWMQPFNRMPKITDYPG